MERFRSSPANMDKTNFDYIDIDRTVLKPSPQRVRNILTFEERVCAIRAYDCRPMYTKVAKMFNCSWEQIKNIIANRDAIMEFYEATKNKDRNSDPCQEEIRQRKIKFLGECVYEYIQRAQFHKKLDITEELIRMKAIEFCDIIQIDNFKLNRAWINHFKATYNFSLSNRQITITRTPPASLDSKDIMTYCTKNKQKVVPVDLEAPPRALYRPSTKIAALQANEEALEEIMQRRSRKINFLEKALYEYIQRSQFHQKMPLNEEILRQIACEFKDLLKIDNFVPGKVWLNHFKSRYDFNWPQGEMVVKRMPPPPLSLDLRDILSYCSRHDSKKQAPQSVTLTPKEPLKASRVVLSPAVSATPQPLVQIHTMNLNISHTPVPAPAASSTKVKQEIIELDEDEVVDVKPKLSELVPAPMVNLPKGEPPLKIRKIETLTENVAKPVNTSAAIFTESNNNELEPPPKSPGHFSEHSDDDEPLPKHISDYNEALKLLKPLEEFAMLEENYRVIGLISQLEEIFKNPPKKEE